MLLKAILIYLGFNAKQNEKVNWHISTVLTQSQA